MKSLRPIFAAALGLLLTACASTVPQLRMEARRDPLDESVVSPQLVGKEFKKIMVLPPAGEAGKYDAVLALFQREFLRHGLTVISADVTARAAAEGTPVDPKLSDAEKALVLAKRTGADAILQIGQWEWSKEPTQNRFFVYDEASGDKSYREVSKAEYDSHPGARMAFPSVELRFVGRLTNLATGEVLGLFDVKSPANFNLPARYIANVETKSDQAEVIAETFHYSRNEWTEASRKVTESEIIRSVCHRITRDADAPAIAQPLMPEADKTAPEREVKSEAPPAPETRSGGEVQKEAIEEKPSAEGKPAGTAGIAPEAPAAAASQP